MKSIFVGPDGLRAGWRFAIFALLWTVISNALLFAAQKIYTPHSGMNPVDFVVSDGLSFVAVLVVLLVMSAFERRRVDSGLRFSAGFAGRFGAGLVWGFVPVSATMAGIALLGGASFAGWTLSGAAFVRQAFLWVAMMVVIGLFEESLFRGYVLSTLARGMGRWPAAVALSVVFGGLHFFTKPMETVADGVSVSLIGLFVCLTIFRTGDLWLAVGFHAAFDFFALAFFGAPNTGNDGKPLAGHLLATTFHGPAWLTGAQCGIEASLLMIAVTILMFPAFSKLYPETASVAAAVAPSPSPAEA